MQILILEICITYLFQFDSILISFIKLVHCKKKKKKVEKVTESSWVTL